jgi:hypothetical protein
VAPTLKLVKDVTNNDGGLAEADAWTLTAAGDVRGFSDSGDSTTFHTVTAGQAYTLSEEVVAGYSSNLEWSCNGGILSGGNKIITLGLNEDVTCTITNDDIPALACRDIKPIDALSMVWNGPNGVNVLTEGGQLFENVQNGNQITFSTAGLGNDVDLTLSGAVNGTSTFHVSCSDDGMNGAEDCGSNQGNGKNDDSGLNNEFLLDAMIGESGAITCNLPNTGVVDPDPIGGPSGDEVTATIKEIRGKEYKFFIDNNSNVDVVIARITITWPTVVNGKLQEIKKGRSKIYDMDTLVSPATITAWIDSEDKRRIKVGEKKEYKFKFENDADLDASKYTVEIEFDDGSIATIP